MKSISMFTSAILLTLAVALFAEDKLDLKLNLKPGDVFISTTDFKQTVMQTVDGEEQALEQEMLMTWKYSVLKINKSGEIEVDLNYQRIKVLQNYGHQVSEYDSDNPPTYLDPSMKGLAALPGSRLQVKFNSSGKVLGINGSNEMIDRMIAEMNLPDTPQKDQVIKDLRVQFGQEALKKSFEQATSFYPSKPITVGESWNNEMNITTGLPMKLLSTYNLASRENGVAAINMSSEITSDTSSNTIGMGGLSMTYDISGDQAGTILIDEGTGLPTSSDIKINFAGTVTVSGVPDQEPQSWPLSASGSVLITFQKQ